MINRALVTADDHYAAFFDLFNRASFFEAHEVLEVIWLDERKTLDGNFYKGLIQLAGAFVHVQKFRYQPACSLLNLARTNLKPYDPYYKGLSLGPVHQFIASWLGLLKARQANPQTQLPAFPRLCPWEPQASATA